MITIVKYYKTIHIHKQCLILIKFVYFNDTNLLWYYRYIYIYTHTQNIPLYLFHLDDTYVFYVRSKTEPQQNLL